MPRSTPVPGDALAPQARAAVLSAFIYRWTTDNPHRQRAYGICPACWVIGGSPGSGVPGCPQYHPVIPLSTDAAWLTAHAFHVRRDGRLDSRYAHAEPL